MSHLNCEFENKIRQLAYKKWEEAGCPITGQDARNTFWYEAEKEVLAEHDKPCETS
jgi:hypothetical protein